MSDNRSRLRYLLQVYLSDKISESEGRELVKLLEISEYQAQFADILQAQLFSGELDVDGNHPSSFERIKEGLNQKLKVQYPSVHRVHFLKTAWFRYAAAVLIILGVAAYFFTTKQNIEKPIIVQEHNAVPGTDKAILTLSDGKQVILDNAEIENIADGNISIEKADGVLTYTGLATDAINISYNTMNTPRGGQYQLVLPDGSKVWLNSASSLKYPTVFKGENRIVELSGEAYFDIKANKEMPFVVKTQNAEVLVLGTAFNINSYSDEPAFSATLIDGSVKVSAGSNAKVLSPGQQAQLLKSRPNNIEIKNGADVNQIIAWQKGIFKFDGVSIDVIARQLSRWYDVEIKTDIDDNNNFRFNGGINKKTPLKTLLEIFNANGVKHKRDNNTITLYLN